MLRPIAIGLADPEAAAAVTASAVRRARRELADVELQPCESS